MWSLLISTVVLGSVQSAAALWSCASSTDCTTLSGSVCTDGDCVCPPGQQSVLGGTLCVDLSPYHTSPCVEDHQCSRLSTAFECRRADGAGGSCQCQRRHHYFLGRCWPTADFGEPCSRSEQCLSVLRDPYSLVCGSEGVCVCAQGYYERQRGECRKSANGVGEGCVLDEDCQFPGGLCDIDNFQCYDSATQSRATRTITPPTQTNTTVNTKLKTVTSRQQGVACSAAISCREPFECSVYGSCVCPRGYYASDDGSVCYAELGSPAPSADICVGLLATVIDGVCTCPNNFYFDDNMRDCVKATRRIGDSCVSDANCLTFGAAGRCAAPDTFGFRTCECIPELAVLDAGRIMCRLFAGIGQPCDADTRCLAGDLEIDCVVDQGQTEGICSCPEGYAADGALCLTTGLDLGAECQASVECTASPNLACESNVCSCDSTGYQEIDGACAPIIGGTCSLDSDCVIENTLCLGSAVNNGTTCQCGGGYVQFEDICWPDVSGYEADCNVTAQCQKAIGEASSCVDNTCVCDTGYHYRDTACWPQIDLFAQCSRTSQCYLGGFTDRVVCRNSICQCAFEYPFSEELGTCTSSAETVVSSVATLVVGFIYLSLAYN